MSDRFPGSATWAEVQVALVGAGKWGQRLAQALGRQSSSSLRWICDRDPVALSNLAVTRSPIACLAAEAAGSTMSAARYAPRLAPALTTDLEEVLADPLVEAVVVAVDPSVNGEVALRALERGKHVLIEKPFATSLELGERILREAESRGLVAGVGHVLRYQPAFRVLDGILATGELGTPFGLVAQRLGSHRRRELGPWWVLAPHDLSLAAAWFGGAAHEVRVSEGLLVDARLQFAAGAFGRLLLGAHPERKRDTLLLTPGGAVRVDEGGSDIRVELYPFSAAVAKDVRERLSAAMHEPFVALQTEMERLLEPLERTPLAVPPGDALDAELAAFSRAVRRGEPLPTSVRASLPVLEMLVAGDRGKTSAASGFRGEAVRSSTTRPAYDGFA